MRGRFEQLVRQIADESSPGDAGLVISSETKAAYQGLLAIYHQIVESAVQAWPQKKGGLLNIVWSLSGIVSGPF